MAEKGVAHLAEPLPDAANKPQAPADRRVLWRLLPWIRPHGWVYAGLGLILLLDAALGPVSAWILEVLTDAAVAGEVATVRQVAWLAAGLVLVHMAHAYVNVYLKTLAVERVKRDLKVSIFRHALGLPAAFFDRTHSGDLVSRLTNDIDTVSGALGGTLLNLVRYPVAGLVAFAYLLTVNWQLALISVLIGPANLLLARWLGKAMRDNRRTLQAHLGHVNAFVRDVLRGQVMVRAFTVEREVREHYRQQNRRTKDLELVEARLSALLGAGSMGLMFVSFMVTIGIGSFYVVEGVMSVGELLGFFVLLQSLTQPFQRLGDIWASLQRSLAAAERLFEVLDEKPFHSQALDAAATWADSPPPLRHGITLDRVTFSYDGQTPVLRDVGFHARAGAITGFVGESGAGKTTIFRLLAGLYLPDDGRILIDGEPLEALLPQRLYSMLSVVTQTTHLFTGTVGENIAYGRPGARDEEVRAAARLAAADAFIQALPDGYDTQLGEDGVTLSGGQRQRLAMARAFLKDAPVLLLDEATAHLDVATEALIQERLSQLMAGRTTLVIAHRLDTLRQADQLVVLEDGRVVERGTHEELLRRGGVYAALRQKQDGAQ